MFITETISTWLSCFKDTLQITFNDFCFFLRFPFGKVETSFRGRERERGIGIGGIWEWRFIDWGWEESAVAPWTSKNNHLVQLWGMMMIVIFDIVISKIEFLTLLISDRFFLFCSLFVLVPYITTTTSTTTTIPYFHGIVFQFNWLRQLPWCCAFHVLHIYSWQWGGETMNANFVRRL